MFSHFRFLFSFCLALFIKSALGSDSVNYIVNPGYENSSSITDGWGSVWTSNPSNSGNVTLVTYPQCHSGSNAAKVYINAQSWSFQAKTKITVQVSQILRFSAWVLVSGSGKVSISVVAYNGTGTVLNWNLGQSSYQSDSDGEWIQLRTMLTIPEKVATILPRAGGNGPVQVLIDDWVLTPAPSFTFTVDDSPSYRSMLTWPFSRSSIWNLPIGQNAVYVAANLNISSNTYIEADPDVLLLDNTQPTTDYYYSSAGWSGASRCPATLPQTVKMTAPFPPDFFLVNSLNNYGTAVLMPDGLTIKQTQPIAHCNSSYPVTTGYVFADVNITGPGITGAHGGSDLSAIGGTIRLGEFIPDSEGVIYPVRHALKSNLYAARNYYRIGSNVSTCYRWPAKWCDGYFDDDSSSIEYNGKNPVVRPGSLLAIPSSVNINTLALTTGMGTALAWTLQNYGLYLVDDSAWDAIAIETELQPDGDYQEQFKEATWFSFGGRGTAWSNDVLKLWQNLYVVDNWNEDLYNTVAASDGSLGSGGGAPLQDWAPEFGEYQSSVTSEYSDVLDVATVNSCLFVGFSVVFAALV